MLEYGDFGSDAVVSYGITGCHRRYDDAAVFNNPRRNVFDKNEDGVLSREELVNP
jgi:hypothetical protein